jgi:HD-GYP domain-containing protein (c-di-GMP phosphodiesterase class II)/HAMP domain-containing protein
LRRSLSLRLALALAAVALVGGLGQALVFGAAARADIEAQIGVELSSIAGQLIETLDRDLFERSRELQILATLDALRDERAFRSSQRLLLERVQSSYPDYAWIGLADAQGRVLVSTGGLLEGVDVSSRPWFVGGMQGPFVGDVHEAKLLAELLPAPDGEPLRFVDVAAPLYSRDGRLIGVLGAHLSWSWVANAERALRSQLPPERQIELRLVRADGMVLLGPGAKEAQILTLASLADSVATTTGYRVEPWPDGGTYLTGYSRSRGHRTYPGLGWVVLVRQEAERAFAPATRLQWQLALGGVAICALLIGAGAGVVGHLTRPLRRIALAADRMRQGDPATHLPTVTGQDEVARTVAALSDLVGQLQYEQRRAREHAARAEALVRVAARLSAHLDQREVCRAICDETAKALQAPIVTLRLYRPESDSLELVEGVGVSCEYVRTLSVVPLRDYLFDPHGDVQVTCYADCGDMAASPSIHTLRRLGIHSGALVSLRRDDRFLGMLGLKSEAGPIELDAGAHELLSGIAAQAALALANAQAYADATLRLLQLQSLRRIDTAITTSNDLQATLAVALSEVCARLDADAAVVWRVDPVQHQLTLLATTGLDTSVGGAEAQPSEASYAAQAALERTPQSLSLSGSSASSRWPSAEGITFGYAMPLLAHNQVIGVLEVLRRESLQPTSEWVSFLETLAGQIAIAIAKADLFASLAQVNADLVAAYDTTLESWSRALDLRDKETEGHSQRVTAWAVRVARVIGLDEEAIIQMRRGALLHDIGKLGVPDAILLKPDKLDEREWAIMKLHTLYAQQLLSPIAFLQPALDIPIYHHERWDGSGYPYGLAGEAIPLAARIFAVIDVWDALVNERPYKPAWPAEQARAYLEQAVGTQFDPMLVAIFLRLLDEQACPAESSS